MSAPSVEESSSLESSSELADEEEEEEEVRETHTAPRQSAPQLLCDYFVVCGLAADAVPQPFGSSAAPAAAPEKKGGSALRRKKEKVAEVGVPYKASEIHRYPLEDQPDRQLPSHLWVFLFPSGLTLEEHPLPPRFFVNALTYADGTRSYVISIKFYEETAWPNTAVGGAQAALRRDLRHTPRASRRKDDGTNEDKFLYAPKAIGYVTQLPLFSFFKQYLAEIFLMCQSSAPSSNVPVERYISQLIAPVPLTFSPSQVFDYRYRVNFTIGKVKVPCVLPNLLADSCITDVSFRYLFQALSLDTITTLLAGLLTEQKILVRSQHYVLLITVLQSLIDLLLPFQWPHTYIPTVPSNLLELVDAPTPFVMGIHESQWELVGCVDDLIVVDLDRNTVVTPDFFIPMPDDLKEWMSGKLSKTLRKFGVSQKSRDFVEAEMEKIDLVFATRSQGYDGSSSDGEFTMELRVCIMSFFCRLFGDYHRFVNRGPPQAGGRMTLFDEPSFTATRDLRHQDFVRECACRSVFEMFLGAPEPKIFKLLNRLALELSEEEVIQAVENLRAGSTEWMEVNVPGPTPGTTICSYTHFPALEHERYLQSDTAGPVVDDPASSRDKIKSSISRKIRSLLSSESSRETITVVETLHMLILGMRDGNTDPLLAARVEAWLRGATIAVNLDSFERRDGQVSSSNATTAKRLKKRMNRITQKLRPAALNAPYPTGASKLSPRKSASHLPGIDAGLSHPDSFEKTRQDGALDPGRFQSALRCMETLVQILGFYNEIGEVRFQKHVFRDLVRLLHVVVDEAHIGWRATAGTENPETGGGVVVCWGCSETNPTGYVKCVSCGEEPLGSGADVDSVSDDDAGSSVGDSNSGVGAAAGDLAGTDAMGDADVLPISPPPLPPKRKPGPEKLKQLYVPSSHEKPYFQVLQSVIVIASSAFHSASGGCALQHFNVEEKPWPVLKSYEFWEYCIFSDFMRKTGLPQVADPQKVPPYPDLFPIAAFYANAMMNAHVPFSKSSEILEKLPCNVQITSTLRQLSERLYGATADSELGSSGLKKSSGVRVLHGDEIIRKQTAAQIHGAASVDSVTAKPLRQRPPPPQSSPMGLRQSTNEL